MDILDAFHFIDVDQQKSEGTNPVFPIVTVI